MSEIKKSKELKKIWHYFFRKEKLWRDSISILLSILLIGTFMGIHFKSLSKNNRASAPIPEEDISVFEREVPNEAEDPTVDTERWKTYATQWYGFELKYPENWERPTLKDSAAGDAWEYRYQFRKPVIEENNFYVGFDVVVYGVNKTKQLSATDEFPKIKNEYLEAQGVCQEIEGHLAENDEYPAEQIYVDGYDHCYHPAYFYTLTRDNYIYNIVPALIGEENRTIQSEREIIRNFPEFISVASSFNLIDIVRPKAKPAAPKITAPMPVWYDVINGKLVCAKRNDKPGKSVKGKKKHLDMECCLDPDEYPNPHCYYPKDKYGKYL